MAANSATAIPNAGMGAGTNNASAIVFRPIGWGDLDAVVDLFDRTWPQDVDKVGADMSRLISRYFVLHYLLPTTFANGAFAADGTLAGVTFIRVAGEAPQLDEIEVGEEMKALECRIDADPEAAKHMAALREHGPTPLHRRSFNLTGEKPKPLPKRKRKKISSQTESLF